MTLWLRAVVLGVIAAGLVSVATASVSLTPAPGAPDPKLMVLVSPDLGGARISDQGYYKDGDFPSVISYSRSFDEGRVGSIDLFTTQSDAEVGTSAGSTARYVRAARQSIGSIISELAEDDDLDLAIGRPRSLGAGDDGFDVLITARGGGIRLDLHLAVFRVERVLGMLLTMGAPGERVPIAVPRKLAKIMVGRMRTELAPVATRVPTITGTAQEGQVLTASKGTWLHKPTAYAYQWRRCDAPGEACSAIPGATAATYTLTTADVGSTVRVAVTARNAVASATAVSVQTAVVAPTTPPANTSPPAISGTAQQGQTLTASAGTWTGAPTSFAYQWQRCDAAGTTCTDVASAPSIYYQVSAGDAGQRIRVAVTATNAVGSTTAYSAPTDVVP